MAKKFGLLFPGQGTIKVGMGKDVYDIYPEAKAIFDEADKVLEWPLSEICFEGPEELLIKTVNTQLGVLVTSAAVAAVFRKEHKGIPAFLAGQSLGYFSALLYAEVLTFREIIEIVRKRAVLMEEQCLHVPGLMVAIREPKDIFRINCVCQNAGIVISNYNLHEIVIAGRVHCVNEAVEEIRAQGLAGRKMIIPLRTEGAFHTKLMTPVKAPLANFLKRYNFSAPKIPIIGNSAAQTIDTAEAAAKEVIDQLDQPVLWQQSIEEMVAKGVENFEEIGDSEVLSRSLNKWLIALGSIAGGAITVGAIIWHKWHKRRKGGA